MPQAPQDLRCPAIGMSQGNLLREGAAHRDTGQVDAPPSERVQHPDHVGRQVHARVPRLDS